MIKGKQTPEEASIIDKIRKAREAMGAIDDQLEELGLQRKEIQVKIDRLRMMLHRIQRERSAYDSASDHHTNKSGYM